MLGAASAILVSRLVLGLTATAMPPVSVAAAPDLPCPSPAAIQQALAEVRGADAPVGANAFALRLEKAPGGLRADLADPLGAPVWSRALTTAPSECESAARAVALIVERHFRELAWTPEPAPPPPVLPTPPLVEPAPATVSTPAAAPPVTRPPPRVMVALGPAYWTRANTFGVLLDARARLPRGPLVVGLGLLAPPSDASVGLGSSGGQVEVAAWPVLGSIGVAHAPARNVALHAAAELMLTVERGQTQSIVVPATAWRTVLAGGLAAGASLALGDNLLLTARLAGYRAALGRSYTVAGIGGNVLDPPRWQAILGLGLGWIIRP
ncbi:MAG TPA: hypothetical protein VHU40_06815 [Polyangia bacterium]|nr:hypothetical protein [Polyangia bacterium]